MSLVVQDFQGANNADLAGSTARIIKGASWKKTRIVSVIPAGAMMPSKVALSLWNLIYPPNQGVFRILAEGMEVGIAYSESISQILAHPELSQFEFLLTIEHDQTVPSDGVMKLIEAMEEHPEYDAISGLYWTRGEGGQPQCWGDVKDPIPNFRPQPPDPNGGVIEVVGIGMGFALWRLKMFKDERLRKPWFKTVAGAEGVGTQDLYFASDARKHGHRFAVHCGCKVGHLDISTGIVW